MPTIHSNAATAPRKTLSLPKTGANIRAALKAGEGATAVRPTRTSQRQQVAIEKVWVETLHSASGFHRDALAIEMAVGLAVYVQKGDAAKPTKDAKKVLMDVYAKAGYACNKPTEADYKTVSRRINVAADLFTKYGREELQGLMGDGKPDEQMGKLRELVVSLKLNTVNDILAYVGKPVTVKRPRNTAQEEPKTPPVEMSEADKLMAEATGKQIADRREAENAGSRRAADQLPPGRIIASGVVSCPILPGATYEDVLAVAEQLMTFAKSFLIPSAALAA